VKLKDPESHRCRNVFAWASRESPGLILQRKNEKNCELQLSPGRERSRPEQKLRVLTGVFLPGRDRSRPERKLRVLTGVVSPGRERSRPERKLRVPTRAFSPERNWSRLGEDLDDVKLAWAKNISFERKLGVSTRVFSPGRA